MLSQQRTTTLATGAAMLDPSDVLSGYGDLSKRRSASRPSPPHRPAETATVRLSHTVCAVCLIAWRSHHRCQANPVSGAPHQFPTTCLPPESGLLEQQPPPPSSAPPVGRTTSGPLPLASVSVLV